MIAQPMLEQEVFAENMDPRKGCLEVSAKKNRGSY